MSDSEYDDEEIKKISKLTGKTLIVYWELLKSGTYIGVREIQKKLHLSSPSLAFYHLEKLNELNLVEKNTMGAYIVKKKADIAELKDIIIIRLTNRVILLPKYVFYAVFFTFILGGYLILFFPKYVTIELILLLVTGTVSAIYFWVETYRLYKNRPF
ncbi:MAG: hypothetical protein ACFFD1_11125 [Candidatus Thorarchaeota archaeon]